MDEMRADLALVATGLAPSRTAAQRAIADGRVLLADAPVRKPSQPVDPALLRLLPTDEEYVSRGAYKLLAALDTFAVDPAGLVCADIGASTGGFTQVLLRRGARQVYAVDVGIGQLAPAIRADPRVVVMERTNARQLQPSSFAEPIELIVYDVSFISATLLYPALRSVLGDGGRIVGLIKPQFEAGRQAVGKGGIVRSPQARMDAIIRCRDAAMPHGLSLCACIPSPIAGGDGNREFLCLLESGHKARPPLSDSEIRGVIF